MLARTLAERLTGRPHRRARGATPRSSPGRTPTPGRPATGSADAGVVVRDLPGRPYVRASVGAWNDEGDLERLLAAA